MALKIDFLAHEEKTSRNYIVTGPDNEGHVEIELEQESNSVWLTRTDVELILRRYEMQTELEVWNHILMLRDLRTAIGVAWEIPLKPMSQDEQNEFNKKHPGAHMVISDFEIKCLHPEKYDL